MLAPHEFTVGSFGSATPLSLILPRNKHEAIALIGHIDKEPAAVFLSEQHAFRFFPSAGNDRWHGLIIPNVRIEVDETSLFDADHGSAPLGSVVRTDTRLIVRAKREEVYNHATPVTLHDGLTPAGEFRAGFGGWKVVLGEGRAKRVLWRTPEPTTTRRRPKP